ncbi:unnamed protein product [Durusdinium trenchii]|uniref:Uncharacterized protein n=1 Tax=Durusdinium trenchii TaxID=1381693 RepID=A0ABP0P7B7_9DINO
MEFLNSPETPQRRSLKLQLSEFDLPNATRSPVERQKPSKAGVESLKPRQLFHGSELLEDQISDFEDASPEKAGAFGSGPGHLQFQGAHLAGHRYGWIDADLAPSGHIGSNWSNHREDHVHEKPTRIAARRSPGDVRHGRNWTRIGKCLLPQHAGCFKFETFNAVQAACWKELYNGTGNMVVSAPTGAGKTVLFELAILGMLRESSKAKALYLAPLKALCQEKAREWKDMFGELGEDVVELTGDEMVLGRRGGVSSRLASARVIVATPEMWDALMRQAGRSSQGFSVMEDLQVVCLDEVHMLNMPKRGALLEALVARLRSLRQVAQAGVPPLRFVAVSATVPNVEEVGRWLHVEPHQVKTFGQEFRPVPLHVQVQTFRSGKNEFLFQESLNQHLSGIIRQFSEGKATLVFCATKRACETAAKFLQKEQGSWQPDPQLRALLLEKAASLSDATLRSLLPHGLGYHHAGLHASDRRILEEMFLQSAIQVLFCTQTLALGVNLPARLVIVKGTTAYKDGWQEYDELEILQIMGRAGRPQFDRQGIAVIMTEHGLAGRWQQIISGRPLESNLPGRLSESLLAEVVAETTSSIAGVCIWLKSTFLAVRAASDPGRYASLCPIAQGPHPLLSFDGPDVEGFLETIADREVQKMIQAGLVTWDGPHLQATPLGEVASRHSVRFDTISWLQKACAPRDMKELLWLMAQTADFEEFRPRHGERTQLRDWAKREHVRWPLTGPVDSAAKKVLVLVMLALADSPRPELPWDLKLQQSQVLRRAEPLLRVVSELFESRQEGQALVACLSMRNCLRKQIWETSTMLVRQLPNIGDVGAQALKHAGLSSLESFGAAFPGAIEAALKRKAGASALQSKVRAVPGIKLRLCPRADGGVSIHFDVQRLEQGNGSQIGTGFVRCIAFAAPSGQLLLHRRFPAQNPQDGLLLNLQGHKGLAVHLIHEDLVGFDVMEILGDVRIFDVRRAQANPAPPVTTGARPAASGAAPAVGAKGANTARSKRQKLEGRHEATLALARAKQGAMVVQTLASSFPDFSKVLQSPPSDAAQGMRSVSTPLSPFASDSLAWTQQQVQPKQVANGTGMIRTAAGRWRPAAAHAWLPNSESGPGWTNQQLSTMAHQHSGAVQLAPSHGVEGSNHGERGFWY